ncbi:MAG: class I SAM-dependent methyltransferase [Nitrospirota bacterium]|nr:class I SAM-dependent methyltransferase [Nitrospirota bacterium]
MTTQTQTTPSPNTPNTPNMEAVKTKLKATWEDGDYVSFAQYMEDGACQILEEWNIAPGTELLDVACGAGQIAIPAARAGVNVTGVDIAANLVAHARGRARIEGLDATFLEGDAEDLPFPDASFDMITTLIGAMFAPQPDKVAAEFARVCRPGGTVRMVNWTPQGFVGQLFKVIGKHVAPPAGVVPYSLWGDEETVTERLGKHFDLKLTRKRYPLWHYPFGPEGVVELFRTYYGPTTRAFAAVGPEGEAALRRDLVEVYTAHNKATDGTTLLDGEYLEVEGTRI